MISDFYQRVVSVMKRTGVLSTKTKLQKWKLSKQMVKAVKALRATEDPAQLAIAKQMVKKAVREFRKKERERWLVKGHQLMRESNSREAWKWLKRTVGNSGGGGLDGPIRDKGTGQLVSGEQQKLELARKHFASLACKGPSMPLGNTLAPARIQSQDIMDATFTWTELRDTLKRC
ncbi:hypothetical protein PAPHI01_2539, partial [Pancytospora philotis]